VDPPLKLYGIGKPLPKIISIGLFWLNRI
jgi:hypothetical protein